MRTLRPLAIAVALVATACGGANVSTTSTPAPTDPATSAPTTQTGDGAGTTTDPFGDQATTTFTLPDVEPPILFITDPLPGAQLDTAEYTFTGRTEPGVSLVANGSLAVTLSQDGSWSIPIALTEGSNTVTFTATDAAGNDTTEEITVSYVPTPEGPCGSLPNSLLPLDAADPTEVTGDLDSDGDPDVATVYRTDEWHLHVRLAYGWGVDAILTPLLGRALPPAEAVDVVDIGGPVVIVLLGASRRGASYAFFAVDECALRPVEIAPGDIPPIVQSTSDTEVGWFACRAGGITQFNVRETRGDTDDIAVQQQDYEYAPGAARFSLTATVDETVAGSVEAVVARLETTNPRCVP